MTSGAQRPCLSAPLSFALARMTPAGVDGGNQPPRSTIALDGKVQALTKISGKVSARTTSKVIARKLEVRFEEGCVECEPIGGEPGLEQQGGSTGAG